jgi:hypothetical protein
MRLTHLAPALLIAASASAQSISAWTVTLTSESGGAQTRVSWELTSGLNYTWAYGTTGLSGPNFGGNASNGNTGTTPIKSGVLVGQPSFTINTGITLTNDTQNITESVVRLKLLEFTINGTTSNYVGMFTGIGDELPVSSGDSITYGGTTSGSLVINQDFGIFNDGTWTTQNGTFYQNLVIGSGGAVPEPSTYGLMLGGLALAVVAARRRSKK